MEDKYNLSHSTELYTPLILLLGKLREYCIFQHAVKLYRNCGVYICMHTCICEYTATHYA